MKTGTLIFILSFTPLSCFCQFNPVRHREPGQNEIGVSSPGCYGKPGSTYVLVNDISSAGTALFLGRDVTLDLNGYTLTYADGNYSHIPNSGFEEGMSGWDVSKAPGAKVMNTAEVHTFIGRKLLSLDQGDEITSEYILLPEANRSYYAMCGITGRYYFDMKGDLDNDMRVSIFVDDEKGNEVKCFTRYGDTLLQSCPVTNRSPRLGGGFIFAHLNRLPAGKYRIRIKAETDCLIDEIDIRPAMDAGIGIVGRTHPLGHYDHLYNNEHTAFFDYTDDAETGEPAEGIPVSTGPGSVVIKNGVIRNGSEGILSRGIQSTAEEIRVILDNVKVISSGINTTAVDVEQATITHCTFDTRNPFIINRHGSSFYGVDLRGEQPSEVSFSEFYGGQGCLSFKGKQSVVHHNYFVNRQTVTNHYSIMAMGDSSMIFANRFEPEIGSGIEIFRKKWIQIFNNEFHITAAPPSCEYPDHLSTNCIRIADYGSKTGAPDGTYGNRIYNNKFFVTGKKYAEYPGFIPSANAIFYSASAGDNEIFGNEINISQLNPESDAESFAFYIGNARGGLIHHNRIVTNVTPVWLASGYGGAENTILEGNTIIKSENAPEFSPVKMGSSQAATGIELRSNSFEGVGFSIDANDKEHSYKVFWTLELTLKDRLGNAVEGAEIILEDNSRKKVTLRSGPQGRVAAELPGYEVSGKTRISYSPYTVMSGKKKTEIVLNRNCALSLIVK